MDTVSIYMQRIPEYISEDAYGVFLVKIQEDKKK
jgi:hypothetical protein